MKKNSYNFLAKKVAGFFPSFISVLLTLTLTYPLSGYGSEQEALDAQKECAKKERAATVICYLGLADDEENDEDVNEFYPLYKTFETKIMLAAHTEGKSCIDPGKAKEITSQTAALHKFHGDFCTRIMTKCLETCKNDFEKINAIETKDKAENANLPVDYTKYKTATEKYGETCQALSGRIAGIRSAEKATQDTSVAAGKTKDDSCNGFWDRLKDNWDVAAVGAGAGALGGFLLGKMLGGGDDKKKDKKDTAATTAPAPTTDANAGVSTDSVDNGVKTDPKTLTKIQDLAKKGDKASLNQIKKILETNNSISTADRKKYTDLLAAKGIKVAGLKADGKDKPKAVTDLSRQPASALIKDIQFFNGQGLFADSEKLILQLIERKELQLAAKEIKFLVNHESEKAKETGKRLQGALDKKLASLGFPPGDTGLQMFGNG